MYGRKLLLFSCISWTVACVAVAQSESPQQQNAQNQGTSIYAPLIAQAKADLNSGNAAKALEEAQRAEKLDPKPWEAYLIAGAAQESQKQYVAAASAFTDALVNAPEEKKAAIHDLIEKCTKEGLGVSTPRATSLSETNARSANTNGPTLTETMQFIADKIDGEGAFNYTLEEIDRGRPLRIEIMSRASDVRLDPASCRIQYRWEMSTAGQTSPPSYIILNLQDVQDLLVLTPEEFSDKFQASAGIPSSGPRVTPEFYVLWIRTKTWIAGQRAAKPGTYYWDENQPPSMGLPYPFDFRDEDMANRVAKAMVHAVELCGGGSKPEPF